ncbi:hypothetical protein AVEN_87207-1 [Araneus ventricosus]|uniref:Uncharacterized protein n=1 Tax=Araneus ventricosus TaxID=182803 RepID=A0A4Y2TL99_ARAVE|nr:hypothetical protein AVEN_87207-1 [Araneus ventricosus]
MKTGSELKRCGTEGWISNLFRYPFRLPGNKNGGSKHNEEAWSAWLTEEIGEGGGLGIGVTGSGWICVEWSGRE